MRSIDFVFGILSKQNIATYPGIIRSEAMYVREIEEPPVSAIAYFRNTSLSSKLYYLTTEQNRYKEQKDRLEPN